MTHPATPVIRGSSAGAAPQTPPGRGSAPYPALPGGRGPLWGPRFPWPHLSGQRQGRRRCNTPVVQAHPGLTARVLGKRRGVGVQAAQRQLAKLAPAGLVVSDVERRWWPGATLPDEAAEKLGIAGAGIAQHERRSRTRGVARAPIAPSDPRALCRRRRVDRVGDRLRVRPRGRGGGASSAGRVVGSAAARVGGAHEPAVGRGARAVRASLRV